MNYHKLREVCSPPVQSFLFATVPMLITFLLVLSVDQVFADQYFNCGGTEPTINSNANTLMCDDFEDGNWYVTNSDTSGGRTNTGNDGWAGTIFAPTDSQGYGRCGSRGAVGTNCTSTSGLRTGALAQGWHWFAPSETKYNEIYHRWYVRFSPGYVFDHEKLVFYQHDETSGQVTVIMTPFSSNTFDQQVSLPDIRSGQNQGNNLYFTSGRWYYMEVHIRLDNPMGAGNGLIETWADDCGTSGQDCTGPGTLRQVYTGNIRKGSTLGLGVIHQENWCNNCSGEVYNDQVVVSRARIGPMRGGGSESLTPPPAPTNLRIN